MKMSENCVRDGSLDNPKDIQKPSQGHFLIIERQ
jgi:hypothetical protein